MKRRSGLKSCLKSGLLVALMALLPLSGEALAQASPASGQWDIIMNTPGGARNFRAVFKVEGEALSGELQREGGGGPGMTVKGSAKGTEVQFSYTVKYMDNDLEITMTGKVEGDTVKGTVSFGGLAEDEWSGKRAAAAAAPAGGPSEKPAPIATVDISGAWDVTVETGQGSGNPTLTFSQEGSKISGRYQGMLGESPLSGTINGSQIEFSFKVSGQVEGTVSYKGTTDGKTMQGKVLLAGLGEGTFTGKKK